MSKGQIPIPNPHLIFMILFLKQLKNKNLFQKKSIK